MAQVESTRMVNVLGVRMSRAAFKENLEGWLFASPWIVGFVLFTAGPMIASAVFAFHKWDLLSPLEFVGFQNFIVMFFEDPLVLHSLRITTVYAIMSVPISIVLGLTVAILLNTRIRGLSLYRTIYYLPGVLSGVAVALLWRWIFAGDFGLLNLALSYVGIDGPAWLADARWVMPAFVLMSLWHIGSGMVIYLAGLQGIPSELYEAAEVDGAGWWPRLIKITVPMMSPVIFFELVIGVIRALQVFTQAYIMTGGGPHDATLFYMLYLYRNAFQYFQMGYAASLAWLLFFYILILTLIVFRSSRLWVYYEGQLRGRTR